MGVIKLAWVVIIVNTIDVLICIVIAIILAKRRDNVGEPARDLTNKTQKNTAEKQINSLNEELISVKTGYSAIKKENLELKNKLADKETELKNAAARYSKNAEELQGAKPKDVKSGDLNEQIERLKKQIDSHSGVVAGFKKEGEEKQSRIRLLQDELKKEKEISSTVQKQLQELKHNEADLNGELSKQKKLSDANRAELDKLIKENLEIKDRLSKKEAEFKGVHSKSAEIEKDFKRNAEELQALKAKAAKFEDLHAQSEKLKKENSDFKDKLVRKEGELKDILSKYSPVEKEFKRVSEELKAIKTKNVKLSDFNAEVDKLKKEIGIQNTNIEGLKKKDEENVKKIHSLQEELKAGQDSYSVARSELQEVSQKALDFSKELAKQKSLIDANKSDLEQLRQENPLLREKLADKTKDLQNALSEYSALEKEFEKVSDEVEALKVENSELASSQAEAGQEKEAEPLKAEEGKENALPVELVLDSRDKYTQILEVIAKQGIISSDAVAATITYHEKSGGNFAKYLIDCCHVDELTLAQTICHQFGVPYLPLNSYDISADIIKLVPRDIVEKHWLMPLQKSGSSLTVVMVDPFDVKAINTLEKITGYKVQAFVGVLSDIIQALENYYKIAKESGYKGKESMPLFITTEVYKGIDRRQGQRFEIILDISFPYRGSYKKAVTKDVSQGGVLFESDVSLDIGSILPLQVDLPKEVTLWPILAVIQVLRVQSAQDGRFYVAVKIVKIAKEEIDMVLKYALEHKGK